MSKTRSKSPHCRTSPHRHSDRSRRFPWDEPDFDPQKVVAQLDGRPFVTKQHRTEDPEERWRYSREGIHSDKQRRSPSFRDGYQPAGCQRHPHPEELHRKTPPFLPDELDYAERMRLSPMRPPRGHNGRKRERERVKEEFQDIFNNFQQRDRQLYSPERLAPTAPSHSKHQPRESSMCWSREDCGRGQGRPRNLNPRPSSDTQGRGEERDRGKRDTHSSHMERQREDSTRERSPFSRHKREMDDPVSFGYGKEEELRERHRDAFGGGPRDIRNSGLVVVDHRHGFINNIGPSQWDLDHSGRACDEDYKRCRRSGQTESLHDRFRKLNRSVAREENRVRPIQGGRRDLSCETRSPAQNDRNGPLGFPERGDPIKLRGSGALHPVRGGVDTGRGGRMTTVPPRNHPGLQQPQQKCQVPPSLLSLPFQPREGDFYVDHREEEPEWINQGELRQWESNRPGDKSQNLPRKNPKMPRQREHVWKSQQAPSEMREGTEETLTIKVDMDRPANKNSALCYSSDRQLSLDLVNVGRQRLHFLPMLEHSGTYRENTTHTGTFAQEIITLVHQVKEHYFRGNTITLNERFSVPQNGGFPKEELQVPGEEERPTLNTRFTMSMNATLDSEPVFAIQPSSPQPARDPADLRHNLERRRQERVNGVKITIAGGSLSQHPLGSRSEPVPLFGVEETSVREGGEGGGFYSWSGVHQPGWRGGTGNRGQRRGSFHRNNLLGNRLGPPRR